MAELKFKTKAQNLKKFTNKIKKSKSSTFGFNFA